MPRPTPLDLYPLACTSNVDELRASLARIYAKPIMEPVGETRDLKAVVNHCQLEKIGLSYGSFGIAARWDFPDESDSFLQLFPLKGRRSSSLMGHLSQLMPITACWYPPIQVSAWKTMLITNELF